MRPVLRTDTRKPFRPEPRLGGEEEDGEDSLGTQRELPVIGAYPLARPTAKYHVSHGTRLGGEAGITPVKRKHQRLNTAATPL